MKPNHKATQQEIATAAGISQPYLANIICTRRRPRWPVAKRIAQVTGTTPVLWMEGEESSLRKAIEKTVLPSFPS